MQLDKNNLHHAILIEGNESKAAEIFARLSSWGVAIRANPDIFYRTYDTLGIADARELKEIQSEKSLGDKRFFILRTENFTLEAMQALLKMFEEPNEGNHFFVIVPDVNSIIPTLRSRFFIVYGSHEALKKEAGDFLKLTKKERLDYVRKFITKENDRERAIKLLSGLELAMKQRQEPINSFQQLWQVRQNLSNRGASVKMLLEHLALYLD